MSRERPGVLRRVLHRAVASDEALEDDDLRQGSLDAGATTIADATLRTRVHLRGRVDVLTLNPRGSNRWLEAELRDGTGAVTLVWMGRRQIRGIRAGRMLAVDGLVCLDEGRRVIYNPKYQLLPQ
ncbi:OB-fold nucleic acid binding domain-containing protein [Acidipropionibacterium timonense]|uniref:OB-fold nucleic acid binding domain-containing protein n=1 Tax=Acidipropionibacterium timonense TaxID=2161818 RepID=UPI0010308213|nr:OB-fold nucleic acid binding domain-containing protein [Acidipropionibacterium timonense]